MKYSFEGYQQWVDFVESNGSDIIIAYFGAEWCEQCIEAQPVSNNATFWEISSGVAGELSFLSNISPITQCSKQEVKVQCLTLNTNGLTELNQFEAPNVMKTANREICENTKKK